MYTYKGQKYEIFKEGRMKNPTSRIWEDAIIYISDKDGTLYVREKTEFYNLFKPIEKVPYHIEIMGVFVKVLSTEGNLSTGEIRKFHFAECSKGTFSFGKQVLAMEFIDNEDYDAIWIHIANDYFKMIGLWKSEIR